MATSQRCSSSHTAFLKESFLLPSRNLGLFVPVYLLLVAYTAVRVLAYCAAVQPLLNDVFEYAQGMPGYAELVREATTLAGQLTANAAAYLLFTALTAGTVVSVVTVSAAVTACTGTRPTTSFHELLGKMFDGGLLKGPFVTAILCNALQAVASIPVMAWGLHIDVYHRYSSDVWMSVQLLLFLLGKLFGVYVDVVCTVAIVVSVAEPAGGCLHDVRAFRQAWWLAAEKSTRAVTLMVVKGVVTAVISPLTTYLIPVARVYYGMAYGVLVGFVYAVLYGAVQLWFVAATTVYYHQCRSARSSIV